MSDLILRPYLIDPETHKVTEWCLQLRRHGMPETEYITLCRKLDELGAREIVEAGAPFWLFGDPRKDRATPVAGSSPAEQDTAKSLIEMFDEAVRQPVPYEGLTLPYSASSPAGREALPPADGYLSDLLLPLAQEARATVAFWLSASGRPQLDDDLMAVVEQATFTALQRLGRAGRAVDRSAAEPER